MWGPRPYIAQNGINTRIFDDFQDPQNHPQDPQNRLQELQNPPNKQPRLGGALYMYGSEAPEADSGGPVGGSGGPGAGSDVGPQGSSATWGFATADLPGTPADPISCAMKATIFNFTMASSWGVWGVF